jgi:exosortase A
MNQPDQTYPSATSAVAAVSPSAPTNPSVAAWRIALPALLLVLACILLLYRDTGIAMVTIWYRSETFTHAFVVPPIVLWLIWRRRDGLAVLLPRPALWVLLPVAAVALLWLLGDLVAVNAVTQLAFVALLVLAVPAVLGLQVARAITFPLFFLFFAVPIGEFLLPQLMDWTAHFTIIALRLSGIPVYQEGLQFVIPSGSWSVVEACSGVRYLIASLTVGTLFAYLNYQSTKRRLLFVLVSILVPIVANWMRAYMIVMLGHLSGNTLAVGVDHLIYGWVFFGVVIMIMFAIGAKWSEPEPALNGAPVASAAAAGTKPWSPASFWLVAISLIVIVALPAAARWSIDRHGASIAPRLVAPVTLDSGWRVADAGLVGFKPAFQNPSAEINSAYAHAGQVVGLYLGYYQDQDYERKLVSSTNVLAVSKDPVWSVVNNDTRVASLGGEQATVRTAELRHAPLTGPEQSNRLVAWQIYWIDGTLTASDQLAKVYSALYRLTGRGDHSAVIIVYTAKDQPGGADASLAAFMSANYSAIDRVLRQARDSK